MTNDPRILPGCSVLPPMKPCRPTANGAPIGDQAATTPRGKKAKKKSGDRFAVLNGFADFTAASLSRAELLIWILLYRDTKPDGLARTSQADLARRAGTSTRTVIRTIARLERRGLVKRVYRGGIRRGVSAYRVYPLEKETAR